MVRATDWELGDWVQSLAWAKSLTPGFALVNHIYEMIISVRIDCCAETWLELSLTNKIFITVIALILFGKKL